VSAGAKTRDESRVLTGLRHDGCDEHEETFFDMSKLTDRVYMASPTWVQKLGIHAFGWYWARRRLGPAFEEYLRGYIERESWSQDRFTNYVEECFRVQVQRAFREVPYYRDKFREYGIGEEDVAKLRMEDLPRLPLLQKPSVRANPELFLTKSAAAHPPKCFHTSGTTGTPLRIYWDFKVHQHNIAVRAARSFRWAGVEYRGSRAVLAGRLIVNPQRNQPPFWRYNLWEKQLYLSAYNILPQNMPDYVGALNKFRPATLTGFPSALSFLAKEIGESGLEVYRPRAIITTSEALRPKMREVVERVFGVKAYEEYGSVENCALATECEKGGMHVHPDFGLVELLRADGKPADPGEMGEIVATGFANTNQILLRYRTGDLARWSDRPCACGRTLFPVLDALDGRQEDVVLFPDGREMMRFDFLFKELKGVAEGQVVQEALTHFVINILPTREYHQSDADTIRQRLVTRYGLGPEMKIEVRRLDHIPREKSGKFRPVISRVRPRSTHQT
jgi:phenylacetate-CoA ligase